MENKHKAAAKESMIIKNQKQANIDIQKKKNK